MNYEELLAAKSDGRLNKTQLPIGEYYRMQKDGKYRGLIDIRPEMNDSVAFSEALKTECRQNKTLLNNHQLHFEPVGDAKEITQLEVELGVYLSFEQLLRESPAVVAEKNFLVNTLQQLVEITSYLHQHQVYHLCYSPKTVMVRKGDHHVLLLSHGSFYLGVGNQEELYGSDAQYVAPEVLQHGTVDGRADVYSIGQFMKSLTSLTDMPLEFKNAIKRATSENPEERYERPEDFLKAVQQRRGAIRSFVTLVAAVVAGLVCLALYFDMMPEIQQVEFVKPVPRQHTDDLIDDGFSPEELGVKSADSIDEEELKDMRVYQAKAEEIFRKNYEKEADRILSKIYNKEYMSNSEKVFTSQSESTIQELMKKQAELGDTAGLTPERSQLIASQIIERITNQKKKELGGTNSNGIQK